MDFSIPEFLYEEGNVGVFLLVTIVMGGGAAWLSGRAIASTWRPWLSVIPYTMLLTLAVRFIHFALFDGTLLSIHYYSIDFAICLIMSLAGFRLTRAGQMLAQYNWLHVRHGPLGWRRKADPDSNPS